MIKFNFKKIVNNSKIKYVLTFILSFVAIYLILFTAVMTKKYNLKVGEIAQENIKAPVDIKDEAATAAKIQEATDSVPRQYTKNSQVKSDAIDNISELFYYISEINGGTATDAQKLNQIKQQHLINLSDNDFAALLKLNNSDADTLRNQLIKIMSEIYDGDIMEYSDKDIKTAQDNVLSKFNSSGLPKNLRDLGVTIGYLEIKPNLYYDSKKTEELINQTVKKVDSVMVKKDQIVVKEGEAVTTEQIELLKDLGLISSNKFIYLYKYISLGFLIILVIGLQWYCINKYDKETFDDCSKLIMISILNCFALVLARTLSIISPYLIPLACVPMLMTILINDRVSLMTNIGNCLLICVATNFDIEITLLAVINCIIGITLLKKMQQRNDIIYSALFIGILNVLFCFALGFLLSSDIIDISSRAGFVFIASIISAILTIGCLPLLESAFDIVTTIKLLELSNPNNPLLKKLLIEAPGTYHHSIMVANLAEVAAEVVKANPVLARVSSYYHDVGKIRRPYFFKENQLGNDNPHNKITPNLSTLIITSHVKDGVELAKEYKLPKVILDIIQQHHGTFLVKYFYLTMKNSAANPEDVKEEDFRYAGPIPKTKEAGIVMLADSVEAAVRSINEPTNGKIEEMVNNIIKDRLNEGQLDDCDLTLRDIEKIRGAFLKALSGIYHKRIEYPVDKWEENK